MPSLKEMLVAFISNSFGDNATGFGPNMVMSTAMRIMQFSDIDANIVSAVLFVIAPIGFLLMVINSMVGLTRSSTRDHEDPAQAVLRAGIWLLVADVMLNQLGNIAGTIMGLSMSVSGDMLASLNENVTFTSSAIDGLDTMSLIALLVAAVLALFMSIFQLIACFVVAVTCLSAKIEIILRVAFCPIGIACIADPEQHHEGTRYVKKLLASAFYCAAIIASLYIANAANIGSLVANGGDAIGNQFIQGKGGAIGTIMSSFFNVVLGQIVAPFAAIGSISVAKSMINEAFGA